MNCYVSSLENTHFNKLAYIKHMSKAPFMSEQLQKELDAMVKYTTPFISKMMNKGTLTVEKVEILSLVTAAQYGFCDMMKVLLTTGKADVNLSDSIRGDTALHFAASYGQLEMVKLLRQFQAKVVKNKADKTPLDLARNKHPDIYKYLLYSLDKPEGKEAELVGENDYEVD